ncbi:MAG: hypothetical protein MAG431_01696 [Chloroflexi bacterium]|nr:hypothetical protein [Chloroflexota bacterium]
MTEHTGKLLSKDEDKIIAIIHRLPPESKAQILSFARFLAFEEYQASEHDFLEEEADLGGAPTESDAYWDDLLTSEEGQLALEKLADEALAEIQAGKANPIILTENR